jgi:hypothetical protein
MFEKVEKPWKLIFRLRAATKYDLCEVDKAIFQGVEKPRELIFYLLGIQKSIWTKSRKV